METDMLLGIGLLVATVAVAVGTIGLWWSTKKLSQSTVRYVDLTRKSLEVAESTMAPRLALYRDGQDLTETYFEARIEVETSVGDSLRISLS